MKVLAVIPARGGSKGIKNKNIRLVNGKPLISYTIEKAQECNLITELIVSTDDNDIIDVVKKHNCDYLLRSKENARDESTIESVLFEVLKGLKQKYEVVIVLQPTAPIREVEDIGNVIKMLQNDKSLESVVSVVELNDIHPARMYTLSKELDMIALDKDLKPVYLRNGAIYATNTESLLKNKKLISDNKKAYIMPESKWLNIDTQRDILMAEVMLSEWIKGKL